MLVKKLMKRVNTKWQQKKSELTIVAVRESSCGPQRAWKKRAREEGSDTTRPKDICANPVHAHRSEKKNQGKPNLETDNFTKRNQDE
jgi:hypothetical protein